MNVFSIISVILGSVIGAGFSTGQEVLYFFTQYDKLSYSYIFISSIFLFLYLSLFSSHEPQNRTIYKLIKIYILFFSVVSLAVMFSAFGQLGYEFFKINKYFFTFICFFASILIFEQGLSGIITVNRIVVPFLIIMIVIISAKEVFALDAFKNLNGFYANFQSIRFDIMPPLLYATYNSLLALPVIYKIKAKAQKKQMNIAILFSATLIFVLLSLINLTILKDPHAKLSQMPLLKACDNQILQYAVIVCTFLEILTTVLANYVGIEYAIKKPKLKILTIGIALLIGFNNFQTTLRVLYTLMGYIGFFIIFIICLSIIVLPDKR